MSDRLRPTVLVVDDNLAAVQALTLALTDAGFVVAPSPTAADALSRLGGYAYDAFVVNVDLPDGDGLDLLDRAVARYPHIRCVVTGDAGRVDHAVRALKSGAVDFLIKPMDPSRLVQVLRGAVAERHPAPRMAAVRARVDDSFRFGHMVGASPIMVRLFEKLELVAPTHGTVLLHGETGTGKELVARTIHLNSPRRDHPFVAFNAAAIPEGLIEAELFGHVKGAFTGAINARVGRFELADRGTLFIDEVSSMSMSVQAKLLRALQEREVERVGTSKPLRINVRVMAATNDDLASLVRQGRFREDLYYRLNVVRITLPPLRERRDDIPLLAERFVREVCATNDRPVKSLTQDALRALMDANWPGNIRQLQNAIEHAVTMSGSNGAITAAALPEEITSSPSVAGHLTLPPTPEEGINFTSAMTQVERQLILRYLQQAGGNKRMAARLLRMSRTTLIDKLHRLGVTEGSAA